MRKVTAPEQNYTLIVKVTRLSNVQNQVCVLWYLSTLLNDEEFLGPHIVSSYTDDEIDRK